MEPTLMLKTAFAILTLTAVGGAAMGIIRYRGTNPPSWLAMAHGLLAGAGLTLLLYAYFTAAIPTLAFGALILFLVAAAGGVLLNLVYHLNDRLLPATIVYLHTFL